MLQNLRHVGFAFLMGIGAILGLLRGFAVSALLTPPELGIYSIVLGIGIFASSAIGLGKIEELRKQLPRLYVDRHYAQIKILADQVTFIALTRILIITCAATLICWLVSKPHYAVFTIVSGIVAFAAAWSSILASAIRAGHGLNKLAWSAFIRGAGSLLIVSILATNFGIYGALIGEAIAGIVATSFMYFFLQAIKYEPTDAVETKVWTNEKNQIVAYGGLNVFIGGIITSSIFYLSRPVVGTLFSPAELGTFSFLMLIVTAFTTAFGIFDQAVGPMLVRQHHLGHSSKRHILFLGSYFAVVLLIATLSGIILAVSASHNIWPIEYYWSKYHLAKGLLIPTLFFGALQITSTVDWLLQANNKERAIVEAALFSLAIFLVFSAIIGFNRSSLSTYLWLLCATKIAQITIQMHHLKR
jgi:O-antigen/teichoic acid export membrane protein